MKYRLENCESSSYIKALELEIPETQEGIRILNEYKNWFKPQQVICLEAKKPNVDFGNMEIVE